MANELLDFVMSVVKDPDMAAAYAADPSQAIADAQLDGVTTADVNGLIPVVSESMSGVAQGVGAHAGVDANVWTSGAADAAFDAFDGFDDLPHQGVTEIHHLDGPVIDHVSTVPDTAGSDGLFVDDATPMVDHAALDHLISVPEVGMDPADDGGASGLLTSDHHLDPTDHFDHFDHASSLDIFD